MLVFKGTKGNKMPKLKGQLRDRVFLRSHLRSSLTPEEGPSCIQFKFTQLVIIEYLDPFW